MSSYMARVRGFEGRLHGVTIDDIMPMFAILGMHHDQYSGLLARYTSGEPAIVNATIAEIERLMLDGDSRRRAMGIDPTLNTASANRVQDKNP